MKFRPCIDIHNGKVKQIVGGSLKDKNNSAEENFVSEYDGAYYARLYKSKDLTGGHIIILNPAGSEYYEEDKKQALSALRAFPGGMQLGGGVTPENAVEFLEAGASHVIVTSYVFRDGKADMERLEKLASVTGRERLVLDLSCRKKDGGYCIVTDRWQKFTDTKLDEKTLDMFSAYCSEFLVHAADAEGKAKGIERGAAELLGKWGKLPVTYAGGIGSIDDIEELRAAGGGKLDFTVGSALDIFGGGISFEELARIGETHG